MRRLTPLERTWFDFFSKYNVSLASIKEIKDFIGANPDFDINIKNNEDNTALMMAARRGHSSKVSFLLEIGADPNIANNKGDTALLRAVRTGAMRVIKELVKYKANIHAINNLGRNALMMASGADARPVYNNIKFLIQCGFNVNAQDTFKYTALHYAVHTHPLKISEWAKAIIYLLFSGADPLIKNKEGKTPIDIIHEYRRKITNEEIIKEVDIIIGLLNSWSSEDEI